MKNLKVIIFLFLLIVANKALSQRSTSIQSTHLYNNIVIQSIDTSKSHSIYPNKIIISHFNKPEIGKLIWNITTHDLHVPQEACLEIDATLCNNYSAADKEQNQCYDTCVTKGPRFVTFDEKSNLLYLDATSDVSGTGGTPYFLFVADLNKKNIRYLNTVVGPYTPFLSPNGKYLALETGWNEIIICNTQTGNINEIREEDSNKNNPHGLKIVKWVNNSELKYEMIDTLKFKYDPTANKEKIFIVKEI